MNSALHQSTHLRRYKAFYWEGTWNCNLDMCVSKWRREVYVRYAQTVVNMLHFLPRNLFNITFVSTRIVRPSFSISHKISKSDCSGDDPVICDSAWHTTWVAKPPSTPTTNNIPTLRPQQTSDGLDTGNEHEMKFSRKTSQLEIGSHQLDNWTVGWDHQIHTSQLSWIIRNHTCTRLKSGTVDSAWQTVS